MVSRKQQICVDFEAGKTLDQIDGRGLKPATVRKYWRDWKNANHEPSDNPGSLGTVIENILSRLDHLHEKVDQLGNSLGYLEGQFSSTNKLLYGLFVVAGGLGSWILQHLLK